ncbi:chaperonin 10-like protein [Amylocarpus encephaloides]|uniref:Chaperonin 10-like protein n=1 Tax=Amylocarpus encephaloides TaxID=45428 RepID=A0A9P7YBU3_9HELO|nr:chaperonin 10-like protein [Amylocarpus encephaloides]
MISFRGSGGVEKLYLKLIPQTTILASLTKNMSSKHHLAAVLHAKGERLNVENIPTPTPGPDDILVEVKSIALNPIDYVMRDFGFAVSSYPTVPGSDVAGTVISVGSNVPGSTPKPGSRVFGFAPGFFKNSKVEYGGFQTRVVLPATNVTPMSSGMSFNEATLLPMSVLTAWSGFYSIGIGRNTKLSSSDKQGFLVWGGAASIGTSAIQIANMMGFAVYAMASEQHHSYLKSLGAMKCFDYKAPDALELVVKSARADGLALNSGFDAIGQVHNCAEILKQTANGAPKLATAKRIDPLAPKADGIEVNFIKAPEDPKEQTEHFSFVFNHWLKEKLEKKEFTPSPKIHVVDGGLQSINSALDELKKGVSGVKLVLEV